MFALIKKSLIFLGLVGEFVCFGLLDITISSISFFAQNYVGKLMILLHIGCLEVSFKIQENFL
jgi:fumarate reductase subunit D